MIANAPDLAIEYEALIQFLYLAPVGLAQIGSDGEILMINPAAAQLLMPLTHDATLSNLFALLGPALPELRHTVAAFAKPHGLVCDGLRIQVGPGVRGGSHAQSLALTLLKLDDARLMVVLSDISQQVQRETRMRRNDAWLGDVLTSVGDYALVGLDERGRVVEWNASIGRVTGFDAAAVVGQPFSVFYPPATITAERVAERLREADENGCSADHGWTLRADGSRFWGSGLVTRLPVDDLAGSWPIVPSATTGHAYCLIIRELTDSGDTASKP